LQKRIAMKGLANERGAVGVGLIVLI